MPKLRVTSAMGRLIVAGKRRGESNRTIAERIKLKLGATVDQRTIGRWYLDGERRTKAVPSTPAPPTAAWPTVDPSAALDEIASLERAIRWIESQLALPDLPPSARATLNAELRQTFKAIRDIRSTGRAASAAGDEDAHFVIEKLRRMVAASPIQSAPTYGEMYQRRIEAGDTPQEAHSFARAWGPGPGAPVVTRDEPRIATAVGGGP